MKEKRMKRLIHVSRLLFIIYMVFVVYFMLFSEQFGRTNVSLNYRYNLELFREICRFWTYRTQLGFAAFTVNFFGNVICFVPFGFFLPVIARSFRSFLGVLLLSFCFSLLIETIQLYFKIGCFDVDDLFLNVIGGIMGYLLFFAGRYLHRKKEGYAK